jgi:serine phosphatase RsbU (regulator of sigma subunit)
MGSSSTGEIKKTFDNNKRRKKILMKYTFLVLACYYITQAVSLAAKHAGISSISHGSIGILMLLVTLSFGGFLVIIHLQKEVTTSKANIIFFAQFGVWLLLYSYWIFELQEARLIGIFFAILALVFLSTNANFIQGLSITLMATLIQVSVTYAAIYHFGQPGNFTTEIFYTLCFLPSGIMISVISEQHSRQRKEIREAKRNAERMRDALWGEMALAKKIQTVLLPDKPRIKGYEIATCMNPADEVGGDYYDIINVDNKDWIAIGDVSGHGVPAGLIMMMVQTSIKITLNQHPDVDPSTLLAIINSVVTSNIRRLGDSKYMTITVIAAVENNKFYHSGLHQDIMIYRAATGEVELIETSGMWIGIVDDIKDMNRVDEFTLDKNDIIFLYTDGLTEAQSQISLHDEESATEMFGEEQLIEIFRKNGGRSPAEIRDAVLESLKGYQIDDDVTMVILKKL